MAESAVKFRLGRLPIIALSIVFMGLGACEYQKYLDQLTGGTPGVSEEIKTALQRGDLPAAHEMLQKAHTEKPDDVEIAIHLAFTQTMAGEYGDADATLAGAEKGATPEQVQGIKLRRAIVARRAQDWDALREHGKASGLPEGKLMAAEELIVALETEPARPLLEAIKDQPGAIGKTATRYLELLNGNPDEQALADVTAQWALGNRNDACENASEVIPNLPDNDQKSAQLLLWAGRAVTSGNVDVASALLSEILSTPSKEQAWRIKATEAIIAIAEHKYEAGLTLFEQLKAGGAPADGLADARATAAALAGDPVVAKKLVGDVESDVVARVLLVAGAKAEAKEAVPEGSSMKFFLEAQ